MPESRPCFAPWLWGAVVLAAAFGWGTGWIQRTLLPTAAGEPAAFWSRQCHGVVCQLCPRTCFLPEGSRGWCRVRANLGGTLQTLVFGRPAAVHVDPIEKKPIFHLLPGSAAFSLSTVGCNLDCDFCQNWSLSTAYPEHSQGDRLSPEQVVELAVRSGSRSIAYTYGEPVVFYEYMTAIAERAHAAGLYNIMITAGYIQPEPLEKLLPLLDVVKVDFKGHDPVFYREVVGGELAPVLATMKRIAASKVQLEVVNLMVPTRNDDQAAVRRLCRWVARELGPDTPLFFSRFTPSHRMGNVPATPVEKIHEACALARKEGLRYVYAGNLPGDAGENTYCPECGRLLVRRHGFAVLENQLAEKPVCPACGLLIPGIWQDNRRQEGALAGGPVPSF